MKKTIEVNPEFASEIVLCVPYAYYLHKNNLLEKVVTSKGMKPFYYFCDNVVESFNERTLDNSIALKDVPNKWIHNSDAGGRRNGVIDYSEWIVPSYREYYKNNLFDDLKPYVVVNNICNFEPGPDGFKPYRYFDIQNLSEMFSYLTDKGYTVIYKRPVNDEFVLDSNEQITLENKLSLISNIENLGTITDFDLCKYFNNKVLNLNDLQKQYNLDYNTLQLKLFSESDGFITMNGGGGILCAYFDKPVVKYVNKGKELRPMYLEYPDSYINKLSNAKVHPVYDNIEDWKKNGGRNYNKLLGTIQSIFK
jgi:hypothetical protein